MWIVTIGWDVVNWPVEKVMEGNWACWLLSVQTELVIKGVAEPSVARDIIMAMGMGYWWGGWKGSGFQQ